MRGKLITLAIVLPFSIQAIWIPHKGKLFAKLIVPSIGSITKQFSVILLLVLNSSLTISKFGYCFFISSIKNFSISKSKLVTRSLSPPLILVSNLFLISYLLSLPILLKIDF